MLIRRAQPSESRAVAAWIAQHHYLKSTPPGYVAALEFLEGRDLIGAMLLGRPASRELDARRILELTRMYFIAEAPGNTESRALAMMRKFVRRWFPQVKLLLSYSDAEQGHLGGIYAADGWAPFGKTRNSRQGWNNRNGRNATVVSPKVRWVRSP